MIYFVHAALAGAAWLLLAPAGVLISRFGKAPPPLPPAAAGAKPPVARWFRAHRALLGGAVLLTVAGAVTAFVMVGGAHFASTHAWLGSALLVLCVLQGANGAGRPAKDAPHRASWRTPPR